LPAGARGIDYGCGPGPTLSVMFAESGFSMVDYDPFFFAQGATLRDHYDFLTCSEAMEHFYTPALEWQRIQGLVRRGGWIGIMTARVDEVDDFSTWYYKEDPTHVCFYARETFLWLADRDGMDAEFHGSSVVLLRRH
jgi:2-polyprenyl-3-methyl-5-hydroxy-6-metoxy-1,4-benzoquinol methylase